MGFEVSDKRRRFGDATAVLHQIWHQVLRRHHLAGFKWAVLGAHGHGLGRLDHSKAMEAEVKKK